MINRAARLVLLSVITIAIGPSAAEACIFCHHWHRHHHYRAYSYNRESAEEKASGEKALGGSDEDAKPPGAKDTKKDNKGSVDVTKIEEAVASALDKLLKDKSPDSLGGRLAKLEKQVEDLHERSKGGEAAGAHGAHSDGALTPREAAFKELMQETWQKVGEHEKEAEKETMRKVLMEVLQKKKK